MAAVDLGLERQTADKNVKSLLALVKRIGKTQDHKEQEARNVIAEILYPSAKSDPEEVRPKSAPPKHGAFFEAILRAFQEDAKSKPPKGFKAGGASALILELAIDEGSELLAIRKTLRSYVIEQGLAVLQPDGELLSLREPLKELVKAISGLSDPASRAEHLTTAEWLDLVELYRRILQAHCDPSANSDGGELPLRNGLANSFTSASPSGTPLSTSRSTSVAPRAADKTPNSIENPEFFDESVEHLSRLFAVPHAPVLEEARMNVELLFNVLTLSRPTGRVTSQCAAFQCVASVLSAALTEDMELCFFIVKGVMPHIRRLFPLRSEKERYLKEQMLTIMITANGFLRRFKIESTDHHFFDEAERLAELFKAAYLTRTTEGSMLTVEDLLFSRGRLQTPFGFKAFDLRLGESNVEQSWALLRSFALLSDLLQKRDAGLHSGHGTGSVTETPKKRRRVEASTAIHKLLSTASRTEGNDLLAILHLLVFIILETRVEHSDYQTVLELIIPLISKDRPEIANWSMIVVTW